MNTFFVFPTGAASGGKKKINNDLEKPGQHSNTSQTDKLHAHAKPLLASNASQQSAHNAFIQIAIIEKYKQTHIHIYIEMHIHIFHASRMFAPDSSRNQKSNTYS